MSSIIPLLFISYLTSSFGGPNNEYLNSEYLIISYEVQRNRPPHNKETFYWIVEKSEHGIFKEPYPLITRKINNINRKECCLNDYAFIETDYGNYSYQVSEEVENKISAFEEVIKDNSEKLGCLEIKHYGGIKQKTTIKLAIVKGDFCHCIIHELDSFDISDKVYLVSSDVTPVEFNIKEILRNTSIDFYSLKGGF